jgi:hypothetical protein
MLLWGWTKGGAALVVAVPTGVAPKEMSSKLPLSMRFIRKALVLFLIVFGDNVGVGAVVCKLQHKQG